MPVVSAIDGSSLIRYGALDASASRTKGPHVAPPSGDPRDRTWIRAAMSVGSHGSATLDRRRHAAKATTSPSEPVGSTAGPYPPAYITPATVVGNDATACAGPSVTPSQTRTISLPWIVKATATRGSPGIVDPAAPAYRCPSFGLESTMVVRAVAVVRSVPPVDDRATCCAPFGSANHTTATFMPLTPMSGSPANPSRHPSDVDDVVPTARFVQVPPRSVVVANRIAPVFAFVQTARISRPSTASLG